MQQCLSKVHSLSGWRPDPVGRLSSDQWTHLPPQIPTGAKTWPLHWGETQEVPLNVLRVYSNINTPFWLYIFSVSTCSKQLLPISSRRAFLTRAVLSKMLTFDSTKLEPLRVCRATRSHLSRGVRLISAISMFAVR